jgi:menaquinone-dependent protoporphyrinogen oxidase
MDKRILVAYASRADSTREVAEFIGDILRDQNLEVDVLHVTQVLDLSVYRAIVLGSAIRNEQLMPEVLSFARKFWRALEQLPTAYFVMCMTMSEDTTRNRSEATKWLVPLRDIHEPVAIGLFAGRMDHSRLNQPWRFLVNFTKESIRTEGDHRDWNAIRLWTAALIPKLIAQPQST